MLQENVVGGLDDIAIAESGVLQQDLELLGSFHWALSGMEQLRVKKRVCPPPLTQSASSSFSKYFLNTLCMRSSCTAWS